MRIKHPKLFNLIVIFLLLVVGELFILSTYHPEAEAVKTSEMNITHYAQDIVAKCSDSSYHPGCYDKEIPKLMQNTTTNITMEQAFQVAAVVQSEDDSYGYCHILGHEIATIETSKNPNDWKTVIHRCPQGVCSNGCLHGAAQERFRGEVLTESQLVTAEQELMGVCDRTPAWNPTGLEISECFHGLGHLTMYVTGAETLKALNICDIIAIDNQGQKFTNLCYEGAYMQLFQPSDSDDHALVMGKGPTKKSDLEPFCKSFSSDARMEACWREGFSLFTDETHTAAGTVKYCTNSIVKNTDLCYLQIYYTNAQSFDYDTSKLATYCNDLPASIAGKCFGNVSNAIIHGGNRLVDRAATFCPLAQNSSYQDECYKMIVQYAPYNLPAGSEIYDQLCNGLPAPYNSQCLDKRNRGI